MIAVIFITVCALQQNTNPESVVYDFQTKTKFLMVAEDSGYGMNEKIMIDLLDNV